MAWSFMRIMSQVPFIEHAALGETFGTNYILMHVLNQTTTNAINLFIPVPKNYPICASSTHQNMETDDDLVGC